MAQESNYVTPPHATPDASTPPPYPQGTSSEEIRRDIARTRADMDETVDALEERLRPRHLLDDLLDLFRGSSGTSAKQGAKDAASSAADTAKDVGSRVIEQLKDHPMPAALIGAGITWLLFEGSGSSGKRRPDYTPRKWDVPEHSGSYVDARTGQPYSADYGANYGGDAGRQGGQGPGMTDKAKGAASSAAESVKGAASSAGEKVSEWAGSARDAAGSAADSARDYASAASDQMRRGYDTSKQYVERGIEEYPLAMGAAAMAVGVLAGLLLPHTHAEDRMMGERSDELKRRAKDAGRDALERGKHVAAAATSAVTDEADRQGLNPDSLVEKVKHVAQDVKQAATESAQREGLDPDTLSQKGKQVAQRAKEATKEETQRQKPKDTSSPGGLA